MALLPVSSLNDKGYQRGLAQTPTTTFSLDVHLCLFILSSVSVHQSCPVDSFCFGHDGIALYTVMSHCHVTSHMWLLSTWNVASLTEELNIKFSILSCPFIWSFTNTWYSQSFPPLLNTFFPWLPWHHIVLIFFLTVYSFLASLTDSFSTDWLLNGGVPHGSAFGPLLWECVFTPLVISCNILAFVLVAPKFISAAWIFYLNPYLHLFLWHLNLLAIW